MKKQLYIFFKMLCMVQFLHALPDGQEVLDPLRNGQTGEHGEPRNTYVAPVLHVPPIHDGTTLPAAPTDGRQPGSTSGVVKSTPTPSPVVVDTHGLNGGRVTVGQQTLAGRVLGDVGSATSLLPTSERSPVELADTKVQDFLADLQEKIQALEGKQPTGPEKNALVKIGGQLGRLKKEILSEKALSSEQKENLVARLKTGEDLLATVIVPAGRPGGQDGGGRKRPGASTGKPVDNFSLITPSTFPEQVSLPDKGTVLRKYPRDVLRAFPDAYCPLRGAVMRDNGQLQTLYKSSGKGSFVRRLFNMLRAPDGSYLDDKIRLSGQLGSPVRGLSPEIVGKLLGKIDGDKKLTLLDQMINSKGDDEFTTWRAAYLEQFTKAEHAIKGAVPLQDPATFRKDAREFLRTLKEYALTDAQAARDLLLSYLNLRIEETPGDKIEMLQAYAKGLGTSFVSPGYYTEGAFEGVKQIFDTAVLSPEERGKYIESAVFFEQRLNNNMVKDQLYFSSTEGVQYKDYSFTSCKENFLRTMISLLCYNPATGRLDINMLSGDVQKTLNPQFRNFIKNYGDLNDHSIASRQAWLSLVEELPGVPYKKAGKFELTGPISTGLTILKNLFGIVSDSQIDEGEQFAQLLHSINSNLAVVPGKIDEGYSFGLTLSGVDNFSLKIDATWQSGAMGHGEVTFPNSSALLTGNALQNLYLIGKDFGQFILGSCKVSCSSMVEQLVKGGILKIENDFLEFFRMYSSATDVNGVPEVFYRSGYWTGFKIAPFEVLVSFLNAAQKMGFSYTEKPFSENMLLKAIFREAAAQRDTQVLTLLFEGGVKPSVELLGLTFDQMPRSQVEKNAEFIKLFLEYGLTDDALLKDIIDQNRSRQLPLLKPLHININTPIKNGLTPLMVAALEGTPALFYAFVSAGADFLAKNSSGQTFTEFVVTLINRGIAPLDGVSDTDWTTTGKIDLVTSGKLQQLLSDLVEKHDDDELPEITASDLEQVKTALKKLTQERDAMTGLDF